MGAEMNLRTNTILQIGLEVQQISDSSRNFINLLRHQSFQTFLARFRVFDIKE